MTQLRHLIVKHIYKLLIITTLSVMCIIIFITTYGHNTPPITYLSPQEIYTQSINSWEQKIQDSERITTYHKLSDQQKTLMLKNWLDHYHHQSLIVSTAPLNTLLNTILKLQSSPYTQSKEWQTLPLEELKKPLPQIALSATLTQLNDILKRQHMATPLQPLAQTQTLLKQNPLPTSIETAIKVAFYRWKPVLSSLPLPPYEQTCVSRLSQYTIDNQPKQPLWENPYLPTQDPTRFNALTKDMTKVLFIGTSQTWGAGASHPSTTFTNQLWQTCQRDIATPLLFLNMSQNGSNGPTLYHFYEQYWSQLNPDIVAINLSYNDFISGTSIDDNHANFRHCLTQFVTFNNRHDITTLFILEAQEKQTDLELHATMKTLSKEYGIQLIDLHGHIQNHKDNQALFWDNIHFTDRGHTLAAQILEKTLTSLLTAITTNQLKALSPHEQDS